MKKRFMNIKFNILKNKSENLIYLFIWLIVIALPVFTLRGQENFNWTRVLLEWIRILPFLLIFFLNNNLLVPNLLFSKKNFQYLAYLTCAIVFIVILFDYARHIQDYLFPDRPPHLENFSPLSPPPQFDHRPPAGGGLGESSKWRPMIDQIMFSFLVVGFNTAVKFVFKRQEEEKNNEEQKKMHIQTELSLLRHQISPHFFMNTLNNIHALVDISTEQAKKAIIRLSGLMGYMLYESQTEKITVQKEMDFVRSYVELMRIRFTKEVDIKLNIPQNLPKVSIPPLLTISLMENAFKHGISYEDYSFVHITYSFSDHHMSFEIENPVHTDHINNTNSGIGIMNVRNRLDLIYGNKYELIINQLPEKIFSVKLIIPL